MDESSRLHKVIIIVESLSHSRESLSFHQLAKNLLPRPTCIARSFAGTFYVLFLLLHVIATCYACQCGRFSSAQVLKSQ